MFCFFFCLQAFGEEEFLKYQEALVELASMYVNNLSLYPFFCCFGFVLNSLTGNELLSLSSLLLCAFLSVKSGGSSTASQLHQSAAADLSSPSEPPGASVSPDQTAYLTSSLQQRSKKPRHFLELKNFKDNYNTLDNIA